MPFPMSHIFIAEKVISSCLEIQDPSKFLIGSLAPDSVHFRENYSPALKKVTHLAVEPANWGEIDKNTYWRHNVLKFYLSSRNLINRNYLLGYCTHIISDISWNARYWIPFRNKYPDVTYGARSGMHSECYEWDLHLYKSREPNDALFVLLENAAPENIPGLVSADEINKMKSNILHRQYENRAINSDLNGEHITYRNIIDFIDTEAEYAISLIKKFA